jgi:hypothetical protein
MFSVGAVLSRSFAIYFRTLPTILPMAAIAALPLLVLALVVTGDNMTLRDVAVWTSGSSIVNMFCSQLAAGAILYSTVQQLRGQPVGIGQAFAVGLKRLLPAVAVALVAGLFAGLATLALIIPGIIVMCILYVAVPVAVVERPGVMASLSRSGELTKGYRLSIFAVLVVLVVIQFGVVFLLGKFASTPKGAVFMEVIATIITSALAAVFSGVAYHDLRAEKDGSTADDLIRVFE